MPTFSVLLSPPRVCASGAEETRASEPGSLTAATPLERLARLPAHTPAWTDFKGGDPGVGVLELFRWAGEPLFARATSERDRAPMTHDDVDNGRLIGEVGVAPVRPAEFVIVRLSQKTTSGADE